MTKAHLLQRITISNIAVGFDSSVVFEKSLGQFLSFVIRKFLTYLHPRKGRPSFFIGANGYKGGLFGLGFALLDGSGSKESFIKLYQTSELVALVPMRHGTSYFMRHKPDGFVGADSQKSLSLEHGDPMLVAAHKKDKREPSFEWYMRFVKDRSSRQRHLCTTIFALIKPSWLVQACFGASAMRAFESLRP